MRGHRVRLFALAGCLALLAAACRGAPGSDPSDDGIHRIRHVIVLMQANRSFDSNDGWSLPSHLWMLSGWSAHCSNPADPMSCRSYLGYNRAYDPGPHTQYAWTDLTWLLDRAGVSWGYFVSRGTQPDCIDNQMTCNDRRQSAGTPSIWNPLPSFTDVRQAGTTGNVQSSKGFFRD